MTTPSAEDVRLANEIVSQFSWSSNVMRGGRLIGQQHIVAEAIAQALADRTEALRAILARARSAIDGLYAERIAKDKDFYPSKHPSFAIMREIKEKLDGTIASKPGGLDG